MLDPADTRKEGRESRSRVHGMPADTQRWMISGHLPARSKAKPAGELLAFVRAPIFSRQRLSRVVRAR